MKESNSSSASDRRRTANRPFWPAFVWTSAVLALSGGFLLGGLLFLLRRLGTSDGAWQSAAAQAHGHIQLFGWGGLIVLGISLHFLPRLLSVSLPHPGWPKHILYLMGTGLVLRMLAQPLLEQGLPHPVRLTAASILVLSSSIELIAASLVVLLIGSLFKNRQSGPRNVPSTGVALLIGTSFVSLEIALITNWIGSFRSALMMSSIIPVEFASATVLLGLAGFLTAISLGMSARLFPLYVQTQLPRESWLKVAAITIIVSLILRLAGVFASLNAVLGLGLVFQGIAFLSGTVALRIAEPRRQLPRRRVRVLTDPLQCHVLTAYGWLVAASIFSIADGLADLGLSSWTVAIDAERHAIGAGFVTILILGVGSEMFPGLAHTRLRWGWLRWLILILANIAAIMRVGPLLAHDLPSQWSTAIMSSAGPLDAAAIVLLLVNVQLKIRPKAAEPLFTPDMS